MHRLKGSALVTGGAGFIGSHLVERLLSDGLRVSVIDDCSTGNLSNLAAVRGDAGLSIFECRVSECGDLPRLVAEADYIFHLAAAVGVELVLRSVVEAIETNLRETEVVLALAAKLQKPFLLTSTSEVYGKSQQPRFSEEDDLLIGPPHLSRWSYACSKLMDEFLCLAYGRERGLPVVIARLFNTVGPRQTGRYGMVLPRFIAAAKSGRPLSVFGTGEQTRSFCYVSDVVDALIGLQATPQARGQVFNIGNCEEIRIVDLAQAVIETVGSRSVIERIPYGEAYPPGFEDMLRRCPATGKIEATIGFRPKVSLSEIIRLTALAAEPGR